jgi:hypothetical protein
VYPISSNGLGVSLFSRQTSAKYLFITVLGEKSVNQVDRLMHVHVSLVA